MKKKLYLDTSIISAYFDIKKPLRQIITQKWIENDLEKYSVYFSTLVLEEIEQTNDEDLKTKMLSLISTISAEVLTINEEIIKLSELYRQKILRKEINDTIHLATAAYYNLNAVVSWNFKHIVNLETINAIHKINIDNSHKIIEILSIENLGGNKYGNL